MADRDDDDIEHIDEIDTGDEGKLVDERKRSPGKLIGKDVREDTAELDEEHEEGGDVDDLDGDNDEDDGDDNAILYTNVEGGSQQASSKEGFVQKMKRKLGIRPKIHGNSGKAKAAVIFVKYIPPPAPHNMPSARDASRARIYRSEKVRYGKQKMIYYLDGMRNQTLHIDDLVMKSEQNVHYVRGI